LRIALLIDELNPTGGTETQIRLLLQSFDRERLDPMLVLLRGSPPAPDEIGGCPVDRLGIERLRSFDTLHRLSSLGRWAREKRIELIWTFFPDAGFVGWWVARRNGIPLVVNQRNVGVRDDRPFRERSLERFVMHRADGCVANSEAARRHAEARRLRRDRLFVVPNAVDVQRFRPVDEHERSELRSALGLPTDRPVVGCVANHRPIKGVDDLVRAFATLPSHHATLALVGDGPQRGELEALTRAASVECDVVFLGRRTDVERIVPCFDVGVLPSHAEGSSNALTELLACGTPTVATAVGGNPESLRGGELGLLVPPGDSHALANALTRLLDDRELRSALAARSRAHVASHFPPETIAGLWERVFRDVLSRAAGQV